MDASRSPSSPSDRRPDGAGAPTGRHAMTDPLEAPAAPDPSHLPFDAERLDGTRYELSPRVPSLWFWQGLIYAALPVVPLGFAALVSGATWLWALAVIVP